jgi:phospholipid/cholesterol/gamma-HCH transport system substrate-binding protein
VEARRGERRLHPAWWTAILVALIIGSIFTTAGFFSGSFRSYVPVTLTSDRSGLVMEPGAKVKLRGVEVGRVDTIEGGSEPVILKLQIYPGQAKYIPANVEAQIRATTAFGAKFVDLIYPSQPSTNRLTAGAVLQSRNVSTEVNTVFQNLVDLLHQIDPAKLNGVLSALAEGLRGQGETIGEATTDANQVLLALNPRAEAVRRDWQSLKGFSETYSVAAQNILTVLDAASTTSTTTTNTSKDLDALLVNVIGFSHSGINLIGPNKPNLARAINELQPTTSLLMKYNPELTCLLVGAQVLLNDDLYATAGGNGKSTILDTGLLLGRDSYKYPDNLPIIGAQGGPGGKPGCGSLPDVSKRYPVRQLITNTGWGTGLDVRPNPGIGFPGYANYLPLTRAVPEPPSIRYPGGPAPGPVRYPGAPPYGAPMYAPDGTPLWPGLPPGVPSASPPPDPNHVPAGAEPPPLAPSPPS